MADEPFEFPPDQYAWLNMTNNRKQGDGGGAPIEWVKTHWTGIPDGTKRILVRWAKMSDAFASQRGINIMPLPPVTVMPGMGHRGITRDDPKGGLRVRANDLTILTPTEADAAVALINAEQYPM